MRFAFELLALIWLVFVAAAAIPNESTAYDLEEFIAECGWYD